MDLSSLEGPPISDARFTPQARYRQPDTYYPYMDSDMNHDVSPINDTDSDSKRRNLYCPLRSHHSDYPTSSLQPPQPRPRARSNPYDDTRDYMQNQSQERGRERERRPPTRLIWLENERTWLRVESRAAQSPSQPQIQPQPQLQSQIPSFPLSVPVPQYQHQPPQYRQRHRQSLDLPPSYGNHLGDLMIAAQPGRSASSGHPGDYDEYDDDDDDMEISYDRPHRRGEGLSRWGAVARRVGGR